MSKTKCVLITLLVSVMPLMAQPLQIRHQRVELPEIGTKTLIELVTSLHQLQLMPPAEVGEQLTEGKLVLAAWDGSVSYTVQINTNYPGGLPEAGVLSAVLQQRLEGSQIVQSAACVSGVGTGQLVELQFLVQKTPFNTRYAIIPIPGGSIECSVTASKVDMENCHYTFSALLNSLHLKTK